MQLSDRWRKGIRYTFTAVGLLLFAHLIHRTGYQELWSNIVSVGWWFFPVLIIGFLWFMCISMAWRVLLVNEGSKLPLTELLSIKLIAEAVNVVAPTANLGGEGLRVMCLKNKVGAEIATGSVVLDKTMDNVAKMVFMTLGVLVAFTYMNIPDDWLVAALVFLIFILVFNGTVIGLQLSGVFKSLAGLFRRIPLLTERVDRHQQNFNNLDGHLKSTYLEGSGTLLKSMSWHLMRRMLNVLEVLFILWILTDEANPVFAIFIMTMTTIVNNTFFLIPGQWGVAEGAQLVLTEFVGYSAAIGISLGVIRRIRLLIFTGIGMVLMQLRS